MLAGTPVGQSALDRIVAAYARHPLLARDEGAQCFGALVPGTVAGAFAPSRQQGEQSALSEAEGGRPPLVRDPGDVGSVDPVVASTRETAESFGDVMDAPVPRGPSRGDVFEFRGLVLGVVIHPQYMRGAIGSRASRPDPTITVPTTRSMADTAFTARACPLTDLRARSYTGIDPVRRTMTSACALRWDTVSVTPEPSSFEIRELHSVEDVHEAARVFDAVWPGEQSSMPANLLRALAHSGNYVVGIFEGDQMVGAAAGFFGPPASRSMHSHATGVLPEYRGRGIGRLLKRHQREWAFSRDVGHITWTFDPLVARNAHFNLRVLGARATEYLVNQYGAMADDINRGDDTDRLLVSWALAEPPASTPSDDEVVATVRIPSDIESLRRDAPDEAAEWRIQVRESLLPYLQTGLRIGGFESKRGYLLVAPAT